MQTMEETARALAWVARMMAIDPTPSGGFALDRMVDTARYESELLEDALIPDPPLIAENTGPHIAEP